jgi:hypothetical protein
MAADTVTALDVGLYPERGAPEPTLLQSRQRAILVFAATARDRAVTAVAEFTGCLATRFGYPGDEELPGHPLYGKGLRYYNISEVLHSSWLDQLHQQSIGLFPDGPDWEQQRHFVITLHGSTFECLAEDITIATTNDPNYVALARLLQDLS